MAPLRVSIVGASGYTGGELLRLLLDHPSVVVTQATSERHAGKFVHSVHPNLRRRTELKFTPLAGLEEADALFLALPHGTSGKHFDRFAALAPLLIDLSADFRLRDAAEYPIWYGWQHPSPERLREFIYALPELHRAELKTANRIAAGGCLATASILALYPLAQAQVLDPRQPIVIEAKVGSSAGGAEAGLSTHHPIRSGALRSFAPTGHRHTAEIRQELGLNGDGARVAFSATAIEAVRGILATCHVFLKEDLNDKDLWKIYRGAYAQEPFIRIVKEAQGVHRYPEPKIVTGTNYCDVGFERDPHSRRVVAMSALDNLMKGAAGQAVHALNVRQGWEERTGLNFAGLYPA
jgi:N-acetyl-gamma-glutamyl-phosphate/LysW-gamma-L-alpha-aminoadipyl-6-phosphate reductase